MKILIRQFLGKLHSWSLIGHGIAESLIKQGHQVHLISTDGIEHLPDHLKPYLIGHWEENHPEKLIGRLPDPEYDTQISYTSMKNFPLYLRNGSKNRFGIWCYEWQGKNVLPTGFAKNYKYCDYLLAPTQFAKEVFLNSGVPEEVIKVIPHGIHPENYKKTNTINLKTNKKFKIGIPLAQTHIRKNIPGILEAYGKAFTNKDDVCLIIKGKEKPIIQSFDVSLKSCLSDFNNKFPNHAEVKVYSDFIDDMSDFYRSIDCLFSMSQAEGFFIPSLEMLAAGKMSIAPKHGGVLDFLKDYNDNGNALLVSGKIVRADPKSMYWEAKPNATCFSPDVNDAAEKLQFAYKNHETINKQVESQRETIYQKYSWDNVVKQIMDLTV